MHWPAIFGKNHGLKIPGDLIVPVIIGALTVIQLQVFLTGYRLTADDVLFHKIMMQGWAASWHFIRETAIGQGRIVHFVDLPFTLIGSYYAENSYFRMFYTGLYFLNFFLAGLYVEKLLKKNIKYLVILMLLAFHPLDYFHLAPNAYPFRISLPLFLILISRIHLLDIRSRALAGDTIKNRFFLFVCFSGMAFSEYGFLVGLALIMIEASITGSLFDTNRSVFTKISTLMKIKEVRHDGCLILLFLVIYLGFGLIYPSVYPGNQLSGDVQVFPIVKTLIGHIYGGTAVSSFFRYPKEITAFFFTLGFKETVWVVLIFSGTCFLGIRILTQTVTGKNLRVLKQSALPLMLYGLFFSFVVTLPVALTEKYQTWCTNIHACIFLDSRLSYFGFAVFVTGAILYILTHHVWPAKKNTVIVFALVISMCLVVTHINNWRIERDMRQYVSGWDRAKMIADCASETDVFAMDHHHLIDPFKKIGFHPGFDKDLYWALYIQEQKNKNHTDCADNPAFRDLLSGITHGERMQVGASGNVFRFLTRGWSHLEEWGVWSEGHAARIRLPAEGRIRKIVFELLPFVPDDRAQRLTVQSEGTVLTSVRLDTADAQTVAVSIPDDMAVSAAENGFIQIDFFLPDASSPLEHGINTDPRQIAVGLIALTVFYQKP